MAKPKRKQHFTLGTNRPGGKAPAKGSNKGVDGIDRSRLDAWFEAVRAQNALKDVWDITK